MSKPFKLTAARRTPEMAVQKHIVAMLRAYMPDEVFWTASLSGVRLSPAVAGQAKAAGLERGCPDLMFIFLGDGSVRFIEVKAEGGQLTPEQARLARALGARFAVARDWPGAKATLERWMGDLGLRFLTDTESLQREARRRAA